MALSVSTPQHLKTIGLLPNYISDDQQDLNYLYKQALEKIAFLPFGFLIDLWRWRVFDGTYNQSSWNQGWWDLRHQLQGLKEPFVRPPNSFDPGAKSHIDDNTPYIRYFVSFIVQFQFYRSMCEASGYNTTAQPLHQCDFYNSTAAGTKLADMLKLGSSVQWTQAMKTLTGQTQMDASAIFQYFKPLYDWLKIRNAQEGDCFGWGADNTMPANVLATLAQPRCNGSSSDPSVLAQQWLNQYNTSAETAFFNENSAHWNYETNITDATQQAMSEADVAFAAFQQDAAANSSKFNQCLVNEYGLSRQLARTSTVGIKLNPTLTKQLSDIIGNMETVYSTGTVCSLNEINMQQNCSTRWDFGALATILATSRDYNLLQYVWQQWRNVVGRPVSQMYQNYVNLGNQGAQNDNFTDVGDFWRSWYEDADFQKDLDSLWQQVLPLYEQLHAYVRNKLMAQYPNRFQSSAVPAHLFGNMWSQSWTNLYDFTAPYPNSPTVDVTKAMVQQNYTALKMFHTADKFFQSLGLIPMPEAFWKRSMITKPTNRSVICHPSAWDFYNRHDYGIKMCTSVTMDDLVVIHHEMGHIQYYMQYSVQPVPFRDGANPGFHEAIGDTMALSVATLKHLNAIGLLPGYTNSMEQDMNFLYRQALDKVAFLPWSYIVDQWRWAVFNGTLTNNTWNAGWWSLRTKYQGVVPPVARSNTDFDPGAKYHIPNNMPYVRYFVAYILEFQFYQELCNAAGHTGPLHQCDFYQSKSAGTLLSNMLRIGAARPWKEALQIVTGQSSMNASAILTYFQPLMTWLQQQNQGQCFGWGVKWPANFNLSTPRCNATMPNLTQKTKIWLQSYNIAAGKVYHDKVMSDWIWEKNLTTYNQQMADNNATAAAMFDQAEAAIAKQFNPAQITDNSTVRQLGKINSVGVALNANDTRNFTNLISTMTNIFSSAEICKINYPNCSSSEAQKWKRDPVLSDILATSRNYSLLQYIWTAWRNATGRKSPRNHFILHFSRQKNDKFV